VAARLCRSIISSSNTGSTTWPKSADQSPGLADHAAHHGPARLGRRIKNKFHEQGIGIPHPQLMVYRRDSKFGVAADKRDRRAD
jgi:hypothetical protein